MNIPANTTAQIEIPLVQYADELSDKNQITKYNRLLSLGQNIVINGKVLAENDVRIQNQNNNVKIIKVDAGSFIIKVR